MGRAAGNDVMSVYRATAGVVYGRIAHNIDIPIQCNVALIMNRNVQIPRYLHRIRYMQIAVAAHQLRIPSGV